MDLRCQGSRRDRTSVDCGRPEDLPRNHFRSPRHAAGILHGLGDLAWVMSAISRISAGYSARTWGIRLWRGFTSVVALSSYAAGIRRSAVQRADAGTGTGTTVTTGSSPRKSAGLVVNRGSLFAAAVLAIIRSAARPRGLRPMAITSAAIIPYCR